MLAIIVYYQYVSFYQELISFNLNIYVYLNYITSNIKITSRLVESDAFLYPNHIPIKLRALPDIIQITEYKRLVDIESARNNIFRVGVSQPIRFFHCQIPPQNFLIVRQLYY